MKLSGKRIMIPALAIVTALSMSVPAYADDREKINTVKLKVDCGDEEPEVGEAIGNVTVTISTGDTKCSISEEPEYYDTNDDEWERGEVPVIRLELEAYSDYKFTSSTKVSVSGFHSDIKSKKVLDSGDSLRVDIKLRKVTGDLEDIEDLQWDGKYAEWDEVDDADKYEVKLFRNGSNVTTITVSNNRFNFYEYMTRSGDYTFKVRAINNSDGVKSEWSDKSEEYYMADSDVYTGTAPTTTDYTKGGSSSSSGGSGGSPANPSGGSSTGNGSYNAAWAYDSKGWTFIQNGQPLKNTWLYVDNNWFYLGGDGYMMTGWIYVDNNWFYLNPISDGTKGAMLSGWQTIDGIIYYLNPVSDGTKGALLSGYQNIDGKTYYFDTGNGALWMNRTVPDGRWADTSGVVR